MQSKEYRELTPAEEKSLLAKLPKKMHKWWDKMGTHQKAAIYALKWHHRGIAAMPTGTGKTWVQVFLMMWALMDLHADGKTGVVMMASHRIMLCAQLMRDMIVKAAEFGIPFDILTIASDGTTYTDVAELLEKVDSVNKDLHRNLRKNCAVNKATSSAEIISYVQGASQAKRHLLVVSTYQSIHRIKDSSDKKNPWKINIDMGCMDEAHKLVERNLYTNAVHVSSQFRTMLFFTATVVTGAGGRGMLPEGAVTQDSGVTSGMEDKGFYGDLLFWMSPLSAIDRGEILPPSIHMVRKPEPCPHRPTCMTVIMNAFEQHSLAVEQMSNGRTKPKLLVSMPGVDEIVEMVTNNEVKHWAETQRVLVIAVSSKVTGKSGRGYYVNGVLCDRDSAFRELRLLGKKDKFGNMHPDRALILHYDILTEGIDLPEITGVMPLRQLDKVKFLQLCGRAARVTEDDRALSVGGGKYRTRVRDGELFIPTRDDGTSYLRKPKFFVILSPTLDDVALQNHKEIIDTVRESYGLSYMEKPVDETSTSAGDAGDAPRVPKSAEQVEKELKQVEYLHDMEKSILFNLPLNEQDDYINSYLEELANETEETTETEDGHVAARPCDCPSAPSLPEALLGLAQGGSLLRYAVGAASLPD